MAGIGKIAIGIFLIVFLMYVSFAAFSTAKTEQPTDASICNGTCNSSERVAELVTTQQTNLLGPVAIILGIVFLFVIFMFLRKSSK